MNNLTLKGDWNIAKGKLKQQYGQLTDNDLAYERGREDELIGRIQKRVGLSREAVEKAVHEIFSA
ncbi:MAG: CsbD family protein [bacterium]|nr:CsbD family protein [bacterium]MDI1337029.1 CsbD family protein [Lacunisphaera sp.]